MSAPNVEKRLKSSELLKAKIKYTLMFVAGVLGFIFMLWLGWLLYSSGWVIVAIIFILVPAITSVLALPRELRVLKGIWELDDIEDLRELSEIAAQIRSKDQ